MSKAVGIIGRKVGMTHIFDEEGQMVPVTVVQAGPCPVVQVKSPETDGYWALQVGYEALPKRKAIKPVQGHFKRAGVNPTRFLQEFRLDEVSEYQAGQQLDLTQFSEGDRVDVHGEPIGKGFMGTVVRHGFHRGPMTHGSKNHRAPGSIGAGTTPGRVYKGLPMAGRRGHKYATVKNVTVAKIDGDRNLLLIRGSIPGAPGAVVTIKPAVKVGK